MPSKFVGTSFSLLEKMILPGSSVISAVRPLPFRLLNGADFRIGKRPFELSQRFSSPAGLCGR